MNMTRPPDNTAITDLIAGYVLDNLSPEEMGQLSAQIAENS